MDTQEMPRNTVRLAETKPSQADLDTACQVLWWMAAHARLFPQEYGEEMSISQKPVDVLIAAANACHVYTDDLITSAAEESQRDNHNARMRQEQAEQP